MRKAEHTLDLLDLPLVEVGFETPEPAAVVDDHHYRDRSEKSEQHRSVPSSRVIDGVQDKLDRRVKNNQEDDAPVPFALPDALSIFAGAVSLL